MKIVTKQAITLVGHFCLRVNVMILDSTYRKGIYEVLMHQLSSCELLALGKQKSSGILYLSEGNVTDSTCIISTQHEKSGLEETDLTSTNILVAMLRVSALWQKRNHFSQGLTVQVAYQDDRPHAPRTLSVSLIRMNKYLQSTRD